jgi:hypothetical protein
MADDLVPDWRVQASFKFGPRDNHLLNVRADDFDELASLLESVPADVADKLANTAATLDALRTVAEATGPVTTEGTKSADAPATQQASPNGNADAPRCAHGKRTYYNGGKWEAFFCPQPKSASNKCDPIFKGDENKNDPYWP